jgi:hypothetical protein
MIPLRFTALDNMDQPNISLGSIVLNQKKAAYLKGIVICNLWMIYLYHMIGVHCLDLG